MEKKDSENPYFIRLKKIWVSHLSERNFQLELSITLILLVATLMFFTHFINAVEAREGVELNDPLLKLLYPINLSVFIFGLIYFSIFFGLISFLTEPTRFIFALQGYTLLVIIRILTLYLTPLNAPANMIPLVDPIVKYFGTGQLLTKDLFFSGHTATMFFLFLISKNRKMKTFFFLGFIIIAVAVLIQHAHYTIDVIAAPFFTYAAYRIVLLTREKLNFK